MTVPTHAVDGRPYPSWLRAAAETYEPPPPVGTAAAEPRPVSDADAEPLLSHMPLADHLGTAYSDDERRDLAREVAALITSREYWRDVPGATRRAMHVLDGQRRDTAGRQVRTDSWITRAEQASQERTARDRELSAQRAAAAREAAAQQLEERAAEVRRGGLAVRSGTGDAA